MLAGAGGQHRMARPYSQNLRDGVIGSVASGRTSVAIRPRSRCSISDDRQGRLSRGPNWRQRGGTADQRKDLAAVHYSMTSSARARIVGGTVRPSAAAVLRLTTSSNVVGCWTG